MPIWVFAANTSGSVTITVDPFSIGSSLSADSSGWSEIVTAGSFVLTGSCEGIVPIEITADPLSATSTLSADVLVGTIVDDCTLSLTASLSGDLAESGYLGASLSLSASAVIANLSTHIQTFSEPLIIVTTEAPYGSISITDAPDALSIEVGAEISLEDAGDTFSITAAFGSFGAVALTDAEDIFTSIPGGHAELLDASDSFSITGAAEAIATAGLSDSLDTLEIDALPGGLAECSMVDAADLLAITGTPETTGGVNLVDASDPLSIQGMGGIASSGISLQDALDRFDTTAAPEETGIITLLDSQDVFSLMGGKLTRFSTHIIQYQKTRY